MRVPELHKLPLRSLSVKVPSASEAHDARSHVLLVLDQFPKSLGGGERIALRLAASLPAYGYRVSILTFFVHPESPVREMELICPLHVLPITNTLGWDAVKAAFVLRRFLRDQNVRIVQTFFESSDLWAGAVTRLLSPAKLIWSRRDMGILRTRKHRWAYRFLKRLPHRVFAVSEQVRRHIISDDGVLPERVQTIYNGLDIDVSEAVRGPEGFRNSEASIVTVGNVRRVKGHDLLIRAAALVVKHYPAVRFSIAGEVLEHDYFAELQRLVADLGLESTIRFLGGVTDTRSLLRRADIFVLPSRSEGFSNAIVEAMACSVPVVATDVGGNAEAVRHGETGLIVEPENARALAEALMQMLHSAPDALRMGATGQEIAAAEFTTEAMMRGVVAGYRTVLD